MLDLEVIDRQGPQRRLLVLIHGYGESPAMLTDRLEILDPGAECLVVAPHGPFTKKGQAIWHRALGGECSDANEQYLVSHRLLHEAIDACCDEFDLPRETVILGGFSQGAGLAVGLTLAPSGRPRPAGCLAFCGFVPPIDGLEVDTGAPIGTPVALVAATHDRFLPIEASRQSAALLAEWGAPVLYEELDGDHGISDAAAGIGGHWFGALLAGDVVAGGAPVLPDNPMRDLAREHFRSPAPRS